MSYDKKEQIDDKGNLVPFDESEKGTGFAERLQSLIGHGNGRKFSRETGISYSKLHNYLSGVSLPTLDSLIDLAEATGTSVEWLATGETVDKPQPQITIDDCYRLMGVNWDDEFVLIPGYRVQVSAGPGAIVPEDEKPCRYLAFRRKWLKWRGFTEKDLVIVWCKGDSMEPVIFNNDTLVVHIGMAKPVDGGIYVLRNHDQLWVKRIQSLPNAWLLLSDNPRYPPIEVPKDEQHNFQIVGKVVHIAHDLD